MRRRRHAPVSHTRSDYCVLHLQHVITLTDLPSPASHQDGDTPQTVKLHWLASAPVPTFEDSMKSSSFSTLDPMRPRRNIPGRAHRRDWHSDFPSTSAKSSNAADENVYPRYFNVPNQKAVAQKVASLEKGEQGRCSVLEWRRSPPSFSLISKPGDHAVFQADLYGGTYHFVSSELAAFGIDITLAGTPEEFAAAIRPTTRLVYIESPSNPLLRCIDLAAIATVARQHGAVSVIDNTFATPINQNPITLGVDVVVHSATSI